METLRGGMIPKVQCAIDALQAGVEKVHIVDGRVPSCHSSRNLYRCRNRNGNRERSVKLQHNRKLDP